MDNAIRQLLNGQFPITSVFRNALENSRINLNNTIKTLPVEMFEDSRYINIYTHVPGISEETLNLDFYNNRLLISGRRIKPEHKDSDNSLHEILYGDFERKIVLPVSITSRDSVNQSLNNGVLHIQIDKQVEESNNFTINLGRSSNNNPSSNSNSS